MCIPQSVTLEQQRIEKERLEKLIKAAQGHKQLEDQRKENERLVNKQRVSHFGGVLL
jgi:hypothetical protein